ncbi:MAG: nucleotidyltransferase domain-containing protein [Sarcina sp.]
MREELLKILSSVVNEAKLKGFDTLSEKEWNSIYDEASAHSLESVIYYAIKKNKINVRSKKFEDWKKDVFLSNIHQDKHVSVVAIALNKLRDAGIPVMVLKGMVLRELYPKSELRSMSDADLLVRVEDLDLTCEILESLGYETSYDLSGKESHVVFNNESTRIEIHWDLINEQYFNGKNNFDTDIWENANEAEIKGVECFTLSNEDLVIHLLTHMMVHLSCLGFGLRQMLDLAFVISKNRETINWEVVLEKIKNAEILKFSLYVFEICEQLFEVDLPGNIKTLILINDLDDTYIKLFIEDICGNGTFGSKDRGECFGKSFGGGMIEDANQGVYTQFMRTLFPKAEDMTERYNYAKKVKILMPFAWTHHIFAGIFNKDYCFSEKKKFFSSIKIAKKRKKLLEYLDAK